MLEETAAVDMLEMSNHMAEPADFWTFSALSPGIAQLIAAKDWSQTPLGEPANWSPALRTILNVTLANRFPMAFWWGPEFVQFYNDAYRPILGDKHPVSLGQRATECWSEIWDVTGPQIASVYRDGISTWNEDLLLDIKRYGFVEETYFTFSYSPLPNPSRPNGIGGVLATVQETSEKVVGERNMRLLRDLAAHVAEARTVDEQCTLAAQTLEGYAKSVPFALIYLVDDERRLAHRIERRDAGNSGRHRCPATSWTKTDGGSFLSMLWRQVCR